MEPPKAEKRIVIVAPAALHAALRQALSRHGLPEPSFLEEIPQDGMLPEESAGMFFIQRKEADMEEALSVLPPRNRFDPPFRLGALLDAISGFAEDGSPPRDRAEIAIGTYLLNPSLCLMTDSGGTAIRLTEKECAILLRLRDANGEAVERERLLEDVWGYSAKIETHTLETHIYRLRRKIEKDPATPLILLTEESGYRLA